MLELRAGANGLVLDPAQGNLAELWFGPLTPLHRAPWYGARDAEPGLAPVERRLAGDFLCLPFGAEDRPDHAPGPIHGWTANAPWEVLAQGAGRARLRLSRTVQGASVEKELRLSAAAPLLGQRHRLRGGAGRITLAHHPMVHMAAGGRIATSPKRAVLVAETPLDPGRNLLLPGQRVGALAELQGVAGPLDLSRYPARRGEDFVTLVEAGGRDLGWTAITRAAERDVVFFLKDARVLPLTMLWISNGGRDHSPWNGRHTGVLGVEDGIAAGPLGVAASLAPNFVSAEGVPTALALGGEVVLRHLTGAIPRPEGWQTVADIAAGDGALHLTGDDGSAVTLPLPEGLF